jgi:hypothetical protein
MTTEHKKVTCTRHLGVRLTTGNYPNQDPAFVNVKQMAALGKAAHAPDKDSD